MKRLILLFLAIPLAAYATIITDMYARQNELLFPAWRGPINVADAHVPGLRAVTLHTADGLALTAWYRPADPGQPTILYLHGNGGNILLRAGRMAIFAALGWGELFPEYRGYGPNQGTPSEAGFNQDALAAYAFLHQANIPPDHIVLYGESLGTGVAVRLATERQVAAVVLDSPYTSIAAVAQRDFPYLPAALLIKNPFPLLTLIPSIHAPLLVMQGADDVVIPPIQGQDVFAAAAAPKQFWQGPQTTHFDVLESGGAAVAQKFVAQVVPVD
jgi:fermentation-respiration switch protein FrsA (DUF1100 family)